MKKYSIKELAKIANYEPHTTWEHKKLEHVYNIYCVQYVKGDSGCLGDALEVLSRRKSSHKLTVADHKKNDTTFSLDGKLVKAERKTNGGRIGNIKEKYIILSLNIHNSTGDCDISPRICKTADFMTFVLETGCFKAISHKGGNDEDIALQPSSRKYWAWLDEQLEYNPDWEYYSEDFE